MRTAELLNGQQVWNMARGTLDFADALVVKVSGSEAYVEVYQPMLEVIG